MIEISDSDSLDDDALLALLDADSVADDGQEAVREEMVKIAVFDVFEN